MKVSYKECTGELLKLERVTDHDISYVFPTCICDGSPDIGYKRQCLYNLDIWDSGKGCKISFTGVSLEDVKFLGGEVSFG